MGVIAYQNKDIASKLTAELLVGNHLGPFGLPEKKVVGLLPANLPAVESNELRLDNLFEMEDGAVAILDYESKFSRENFVKYLNYVARIMRRYANQKSLDQLKKLKILVIYTADVSQAQEIYDFGGVVIQLVCGKLRKEKSPETISEELEEELEVIQKICKAAKGYGPDYDWEQIYKKMSLKE